LFEVPGISLIDTLKIDGFSFAGEAKGVCYKGVSVFRSKLCFLVIDSLGLY
jgi:hypothetical protein